MLVTCAWVGGGPFPTFFRLRGESLSVYGSHLFFVSCASLAQAFLAAAFPIKEAIAFKLGLHLQLFCVTNKNIMSKFIHRAVRKVPLQQLVRLQQKKKMQPYAACKQWSYTLMPPWLGGATSRVATKTHKAVRPRAVSPGAIALKPSHWAFVFVCFCHRGTTFGRTPA